MPFFEMYRIEENLVHYQPFDSAHLGYRRDTNRWCGVVSALSGGHIRCSRGVLLLSCGNGSRMAPPPTNS